MLASPLRQALGAHLGQVLTPEAAAAIEVAALAPQDRSIDPSAFGATKHDGYSIQAERFVDALDELHELHVAQWGETEKHRHGLALNPDYLTLIARERNGDLLQFTMRTADGRLVGNLRMFLATSLHTQTRYASEDSLFILPEHRGGFAVLALLRFAQAAILSTGVREIRINSKVINNADVLMRRMKYQPVALEFVKFFDQE